MKGHYKGEQKLCHFLNARADELARKYGPPPPKSPLPLPPNYEIELLQGKYQITSREEEMITHALHITPMEEYTTRRAGCTPNIFQQVDWEAHRQAISTFK